jgi:predicted membrane-bound spermidine synthase
MNFKKWFSYLIPINIYIKKSDFSKSLEVTWANGNLVLDSKNTNYSYGSLQRILRKGLQKIGFENIKSMQSILLLGVAGGSVIKTLQNEIGYKGKITGIEIDKNVIEIANKYFGLANFSNLEIKIEDAQQFVKQTDQKFDLIIIDIFNDNQMPDFLYDKEFINKISKMMKLNGFVLFNTMNYDKTKNASFINSFDKTLFNIKKISKIEKFNELIHVKKIK